MINKVSSYKTSDNKLFESRAEALNYEVVIELRGVIQKDFKGQNMTTTDVARFILNNGDELMSILRRHKTDVSRADGAVKCLQTKSRKVVEVS